MGRFTFGTKAETLNSLRSKIKTATILEQIDFSVEEWRTTPSTIWDNLRLNGWLQTELIIRSSAKTEDCLTESYAGVYLTVLHVVGKTAIQQAIEKVIYSYGERGSEKDQILIQPMLTSISMAGVVFTADLDTFAQYYIVNYDISGSSESVTSGHDGNLETYVHFKYAPFAPTDSKLARLLESCRECEAVSGVPALDIEFAFDEEDTLYIFQVRSIVVGNKKISKDEIDLKVVLGKLFRKIEKSGTKHPNLLGNQAVYGVMPDWNPAEIIGIKPRMLALSLYRELLTDSIWAFQRDNYGYRNLRSHPLMVSFLGCPFIDVRVSFNSFIPKDLHEGIAEKLVNYYLKQLRNAPHRHDKVEFEIVHSCYYLNLPEKLQVLLGHGLNHNEIKRIEFSLLELTNHIIKPENGLFKKDLRKIELLKYRYENIINSDLSQVEKIYWLIEDCKRYGTLPFAGIARSAFIAVQFLRSFVELEIITKDGYECFMNSLKTVSKGLNNDLWAVQQGEMSQDKLLQIYGHLRPGTYDILSPRYDENFEKYFSLDLVSCPTQKEFFFTDKQLLRIEKLLIEHGINAGVQELLQFIREAIEGREYVKFVFTRSLSEILRRVGLMGDQFNCTRAEMSYLDIQKIKELYHVVEPRDVEKIFKENIKKNQELYCYTEKIKLPSVILSPSDVYGFSLDCDEPNFITLKQVEAETILEKDFDIVPLKKKIAFISSADPGYDYLFTKGICGLITQYGGANSHMAIRCAELGLPAIIGAGNSNFLRWSKANILQLDCATRQVRIIS
jgi:hypothetical protein